MKFSKPILFITTVLMVSIASCSKESEKSRKELLTDKGCWKLLKVEVLYNSANEFEDGTALFRSSQECKKDDCYNFGKDNSYTVTEGATKCTASDPDILKSGTWSITEDNRVLITEANNIKKYLRIETLNENTLIATDTIKSLTFKSVRYSYN